MRREIPGCAAVRRTRRRDRGRRSERKRADRGRLRIARAEGFASRRSACRPLEGSQHRDRRCVGGSRASPTTAISKRAGRRLFSRRSIATRARTARLATSSPARKLSAAMMGSSQHNPSRDGAIPSRPHDPVSRRFRGEHGPTPQRLAANWARAFDENLGLGSNNAGTEHMDLIYRLLRDGAVLLSVPNAQVRHHQSRRFVDIPRHIFWYSRGSGAYAARHRLAGTLVGIVAGVRLRGAAAGRGIARQRRPGADRLAAPP